MKKFRLTIKIKIIFLVLIIALMPFFLGLFKFVQEDAINEVLKEKQADQTEALGLLLGKFNESYYDDSFLDGNNSLSDLEKSEIYKNKDEKLKSFFLYSICELYSINEVDPNSVEEEEVSPYMVFPVDGHSYKIYPTFDTSAIKYVTANGSVIADIVYSNPDSIRIRILNSQYDCIFDLFDYETKGNKTSDYFDFNSIQEDFNNNTTITENLDSGLIIHFKRKIKTDLDLTPDLYTAMSFTLDGEYFVILLNSKSSEELTYSDRVVNRISTSIELMLYDKPRLFFSILVILILILSIVRPIIKLSKKIKNLVDQNGKIANENIYGIKRPDEIGDLARSFQNLISRLNSRIEETEQLTSDLSHEIKIPLSAIRMLTDTINNENLTESEKNDMCGQLQNEIKRIETIVLNIRQTSKIENKSYEDSKEVIECDKYLNNIVSFYSSKYPIKKIKCTLNAEDKCIFITPELLDTIFDNLISNAFSFADEILITSSINKNQIQFSIEDNGPGIPIEEREKIFKRFYSNRKQQDKIAHDGLGLHLVKYIVNSINGNIKVKTSEKLGGASFIIAVPIYKQEKKQK